MGGVGRTRIWFATMLIAAVCVAMASCGSDGSQTPTVTLSKGLATVVASGSPDAMAAKASKITGLHVVIPKPLPAGAYIKQIVIPWTNAPIHGNPHSATIVIQLPSGQYLVNELERGANVGITEAETEMKSLESPGRAVYWNASSHGYTVVGKDRSYYLSSGDASSNQTAEADLARMIPSLPTE